MYPVPIQFSRSVIVWLFATPWIAAHQASLSITNSLSLLKLMSIESVMQSSHLILCRPLLLLLPIPPSIRVFSNESTLHMRWPKYWSFSFSISPSNEHPGLVSFRMTGWVSLQSKVLSRVFSNTTVQKHQFFGAFWDWAVWAFSEFVFAVLVSSRLGFFSLPLCWVFFAFSFHHGSFHWAGLLLCLASALWGPSRSCFSQVKSKIWHHRFWGRL